MQTAMRKEKQYWVYILSNRKNGCLYVGITSDLIKRVWQHKEKQTEGFTKKYNIDLLVYFECFTEAELAIRREKRLKKYNRQWKIDLIEENNPEWSDLYPGLL